MRAGQRLEQEVNAASVYDPYIEGGCKPASAVHSLLGAIQPGYLVH
eukprot:COSAG02_NODE_988_length_15440_cov_5.979271_2_plen_46_part_00